MHQVSTRMENRQSALVVQVFCLLSLLLMPALRSTIAADVAGSVGGKSSLRQPFSGGRFTLKHGDVVAFIGAADVATAQHTGHVEALLALKYHGLGARFRNFGWEGDTVFAQPRDVGFPSLKAHLERAQATVIVVQFGRTEALSGRAALPGFLSAYKKFIDECAQRTPRLVLVTPPPFEKGGELLPDLSARNLDLAEYAHAIRVLAREHGLPLADLFTELGGISHGQPRLTDTGLQFTPRGHAFVARAFARQLGFSELANRAGEPDESGAWPNAAFEKVRHKVVAKNRLWFNYWRPQNWAFLGGDRTSQPSSRDHRNPNVRWFPDELEKFVPLILEAETRVEEAASAAAK